MVAIHDRLLISTKVDSPVSTSESLTSKEKYKKQVERFRDKLDSVITNLAPLLEDDCTTDKAMKAWNKVFNHKFWGEVVEDESETEADSDINESALALSNTAVPALGRTDHKQAIPWSYIEKNRVRLDAYVYLGNKNMGGLNSNGRTIKSDLWLKFVVKTNSRGQYQVFWQVVNTGWHAHSVGGERGDVFKSKYSNPVIHWEESLYTGKHWIECFIVKNGICVARSGRFYVNIHNSDYPR